MIYLDANATEPLRPEARAAALSALDGVGNPSSIHGAGRAARNRLETAREVLAARFGGRPDNLVFCSGGTEANALAVHALGAGRAVIVGATEHDAVHGAAEGAVRLAVGHDGVADLGALDFLLTERPGSLVCLMLANNETGTLQPVEAAASICRRHGAWLHTDAVQAAGRMAVDFAALGADSMAISAHKMGGPAGAGALLLSDRAADAFAPLIKGGGQERGRRGGTPPLPAIAGFAAVAMLPPDTSRLAVLRDRIEAAAVAQGAVVCGGGPDRLANTVCIALRDVAADRQVIALDLAGFAVSAGSACSSGRVARSHVLDAMGLGALAGQAIRVSLPWNVAEADIDAFITAYRTIAARLRRREAA